MPIMKNCAGRIAAATPSAGNSSSQLPRPRSTLRRTGVAKSWTIRCVMLACGRSPKVFLELVPRGRKESRAMGRTARVLDGSAIERSLARIAHEILERNKGPRGTARVALETRAVPLARRLAQKLGAIEPPAPPVGVLDINLYRDDLSRIAEHP